MRHQQRGERSLLLKADGRGALRCACPRVQVIFLWQTKETITRCSACRRALGAFPVDREGADITAIKTALSSVKAGQKLIIFPQGTRGAAEGETKKGAAMLAVKSRAPILPMYITEGKGFRCRATVVIGEAFTPDPKTKEYGALADDILRRIYALKEKV